MDSGLLTSRKTVVQARHVAAPVSPSAGGEGGVRVAVSGHFDSMNGPVLRAESGVLSLWLFNIQARFDPGI